MWPGWSKPGAVYKPAGDCQDTTSGFRRDCCHASTQCRHRCTRPRTFWTLQGVSVYWNIIQFYLAQGGYVFTGVSLVVCLFVNVIFQELLNGFSQNSVQQWHMFSLVCLVTYFRQNNWRPPWKNRIYWYISFVRPSLNRVLFPMICLLVEGECQILVFWNIIS